MRRFRLAGLALLVMSGCGDDGDDSSQDRTVFVEVTSLPSRQPTRITVGDETFEAQTPVAQSVRTSVPRRSEITAPPGCTVFGSAIIQADNLTSTQITMCLSDRGERDCASSDAGFVFVTMTIPESD
jgi:hypothetical protein